VLEFPLPSSCIFFLHVLPPCNIILHLWLFFAIGSIHQESQAVKFNCSCTSGLLRLQLSSTIFQVQLLAVLPDFSGFNCLLPIFKFNCNCTSGLLRLQLTTTFFKFQVLRMFFRSFYLVINIEILSLSNSLSTKNLANLFSSIDLKDSNLKLYVFQINRSFNVLASTSISRFLSELPPLINNFKSNYFHIKFQI
jgi:hypothetical protein